MAEDFGFQPTKEDFGFKPVESKDDFGFQSSSEKPTVEKSKAQQFEEAPLLERAVKGPTAALETAVRGPLSFISGTVGKTIGTGVGALQTGTVEGAVEKGRQYEEAMSIEPRQAGSAYFDEQVGKGLEWLKEKWTNIANDPRPLSEQSYESLKKEAARRSISEALFDEIMVGLLRGKGKGRTETSPGEPPVSKGPEGPQGELFTEERVQPSTQNGQTIRSPYNIPVDEVDRLNRELNPPTEERRVGQGELFTDEAAYTKDELQARRFQLEEAQGGGRFKTPDMNRQVTNDLYTQEGLGGATEQSNLSQDLFQSRIPGRPDEAIPFDREPPAVRPEGTLTRTRPGGPDLTEQERMALRPGDIRGFPSKESLLGNELPVGRNPNLKTDLTLVRHGETALNKDNALRGWDNGPEAQLDQKGKDQAAALGKKHADDPFAAIYTSDLGRAQETTQGFKGDRQIPTVPTEGLRPWDVGVYTGKNAEKTAPILKQHAEKYPDKKLPGGESFNDFKNRFLTTMKDIIEKHQGEPVAVVTHHRGERLFKAWKKAGMKDDFSIDMKTFQDFKKGVEPGQSEKHSIGETKLGRRQGGVIDPVLLTLGVSKLLKSEGFEKVMNRFRGTFHDKEIDNAIKWSTDPMRKETIVFMSPDKFHELAMKRIEGETPIERGSIKQYAEGLREPIRNALKTKKGLNEIPELWLTQEKSFAPGASIHSVWAHEGRHRADVFKEQGLDLMPVLVKHQDLAWGMASKVNNLPRRAISENGKFVDLPQPENWKNQPSEYDLDFTNKGKFGQGGAFNPRVFDRDTKKQGFVKTVLDARKQFQEDRRPISEIISGWSGDKIKDFGEAFKATTNAMIDKTMSIMTQNKGPVGELVKNIVDKITGIDRRSALAVEKDLFGEKYKSTGGIGRPFETRVRGDEGILTLWKESHKTREGRVEVREMLDKAIENIGRDLSREDFKSDKQHQIYQAIQKGLNSILVRVNEARAKMGMKPIDRLPGFLPAHWEGDYRVHVYDGLNNKLMSFGFKTSWQGSAAVKALKEAHPDLNVRDVEHVKIDKTKIGDLSAFEEAIRALGKDDPTSLALQRTMVQLRSSKGFGRHGLQRQGVLGFLGMEKGDIGTRNMERSLEQYVRQANRYTSNIEKAQVMAEMDSIPLKIQEKIPNAIETMRDYIQNSRGADMDRVPLVRSMFSTLSRIIGTGESAPGKVLREGSSLASLYFLTTPRFVISQLAQHLNAFPKYVQLSGQGNFRNPIASWWKGWEHFISPDASALEGANWAQRHGHLDSALVAMLEMKLGDFAFERSSLLKDAVSVSFGKLEKNAVRMPTFLALEYGLRDSIKDSNLRYETAANMMDYYMVHYGKTSRPMMYSKLGLAGEAVSTFKQYSHNGFGQLFEYAKYATEQGGSIAPLLTHIGMQIAVGGLKGASLVAEASVAVAVLNVVLSKFDVQIPDPQDLLMNSNLHDLLVFGGLSTVLGHDVSSSVNAPNVPQMFSAPAVQFAYSAVKDVGNWALNKLSGVGTEQDEMKAALSIAPSAMRGFIEELYSKPGQPVPKPGQKMAGNYIRDENEKFWAKWTSLKSLPESRINALVNAAKKDLVKDMNAKVSALDAIVDRVQNNQPIDGELFKKYIAKGGDPARLADAVKNRIVERNLDYADRQIYNKHMTPAEVHKLEVMKGLLDEKSRQEKQRHDDLEAVDNLQKMSTDSPTQTSTKSSGIVSDSAPNSDPTGMYRQASRFGVMDQRQNRQQFQNETSGRNIEDFVQRSRIEHEQHRLDQEDLKRRGQRMKNRLLTM